MEVPANPFNPMPAKQQEIPRMQQVAPPINYIKEDTLTKIVRSVIKADMKTVGEVVLNEVVIPTCVKMAHDILNTGFNKLTGYNGGYSTPQYPNVSGVPNVSYGSFASGGFNQAPQHAPAPAPVVVTGMNSYMGFTYGRGDAGELYAKDVIRKLQDRARLYGSAGRPALATVGDLCDAMGRQNVSTDHDWGWSEEALARALIRPDYDGTIRIAWPSPQPIIR